ncbi:MAG: hydroxymethylbilane synthase [Tetrasphaera sp.]
MTVRLGTRRSALALTQSGLIADLLRERGLDVEIVPIVTEGDRTAAALDEIGGSGVFVGALREALRCGQVDVAVHSLKDLPTAPEPGLTLAAVPTRADSRDALVARDGLTLGELPPGARVGTGSPRRAAQLRALGLGLEIVPIRGNIDTRLGRVRTGDLDAVVLAKAGLDRLGRADRITEVLDPVQLLPAAGQGALAVECRTDDHSLVDVFATLDDPDTRAAVTAERALLARLEAGCTAPVGVLAEVVEDVDAVIVSVRAFVGSSDGSRDLRRSHTGPLEQPELTGAELADRLLAELAERGRPSADQPPEPAATEGTL